MRILSQLPLQSSDRAREYRFLYLKSLILLLIKKKEGTSDIGNDSCEREPLYPRQFTAISPQLTAPPKNHLLIIAHDRHRQPEVGVNLPSTIIKRSQPFLHGDIHRSRR